MPIVLKSPADLAKMRAAGRLVAETHERLRALIAPGVTTAELDRVAYETIAAAGGAPSFLGYGGFPASICASINEQLLHGIPSERALVDGDIVSIDIGAILDGFHGDAARTWAVGAIDDDRRRLIEDTERAFWECAPLLRDGARLGDYSAAAQAFGESRGYGVVRDFCGHGIGRKMHEEPSAPNYGEPGTGPRLRSGMTLAVEPMLALGSAETTVLADGWTVIMADGRPGAHYENTIAVQGEHVAVLTMLDDIVL